MSTANVTLHGTGADIEPMIYGQYFEHVEDCVDPGLVDDNGVRQEVIASAQELGVPVVRWPGGCFADVYDWRDGIGPVASRPVRRNWHWGCGEIERNRFGTAEFLDWCESVGAVPYINVNLGSSNMLDQLCWLDYCNGDLSTSDVEERRRNGRERPWNVRYWAIGNETWGHHEAGNVPARDYGRQLRTWASFFRRFDPDLRLVGVGSEAGGDTDWDRTVLDESGRTIDFLSIHLYGSTLSRGNRLDLESVAYEPVYIEGRLRAFAELVAEYNAAKGTAIRVAVDEWNTRHFEQFGEEGDGSVRYELRRDAPRDGGDVLFAAGMFHAMIRHADLVGLANYVFLVNGHGVIDSRNGQVRPSALYPLFRVYRHEMVGTKVDVDMEASTRRPPQMTAGFPHQVVDPDELPEQVDVVDAVACRNGDRTNVALINRSAESVNVRLVGRPDGWLSIFESWVEEDHISVGVREEPVAWSGVLRPYSVAIISQPLSSV